jgi:hypothetical protein
MKDSVNILDQGILEILARVRGARVQTLLKYPKTNGAGNEEAMRKRLERLCDKGYLASSSLPIGPKIFRLSHKGVKITGAPTSFAASPSASIAAEILAGSSFGYRHEDFVLLTRIECNKLLDEFTRDANQPKIMGRFVLRRIKCRNESGQIVSEIHVHMLLAELRPASELAHRIEIIVQNLLRTAIFHDLIAAALFGFTVVVPSVGVKKSLEEQSLPVETAIEVLEELQNISA